MSHCFVGLPANNISSSVRFCFLYCAVKCILFGIVYLPSDDGFFFFPLRMSAWELGMYSRARACAERVEGLSFTSWGSFRTRKQLYMLMSSDAFCWRAVV